MGKVKTIFLALAVLVPAVQGLAQQLTGKVTFVTEDHVYVRFSSTEGILPGDTIRTPAPCLVVENKSSISCVTRLLAGCEFEKGDAVTFDIPPDRLKKPQKVEDRPEKPREENKPDSVANAATTSQPTEDNDRVLSDITGRISLASYNSFLLDRNESSTRGMGRLFLKGDSINGSAFSFDTYLSFRYRSISSTEGQDPLSNLFRVYRLSVRYDYSPSTSFVFGRNINTKMASLGPLDGIQAERRAGSITYGLVAGLKPDLVSFGVALDQPHYGVYGRKNFRSSDYVAEVTAGLIEQRRQLGLDRRFAFYQHSATLKSNLQSFVSAEFDLMGGAGQSARLTNFYTSLRYRPISKLSLMVSFDSRKRVVFARTNEEFADSLLANDPARQGARIRGSYRLLKRMTIGLGYRQRFSSDQSNSYTGYNFFATWSKVPFVKGRMFLQYSDNSSGYLGNMIATARYSRSLWKDRIRANLNYRYIRYRFGTTVLTIPDQQYYGISLSRSFPHRIYTSLFVEYSKLNPSSNVRVNTRVIKRF